MKHFACDQGVAISTLRERLERMESHVRVKILREMRLNEWDIEREPVGWFPFEEASQFDTLPEIFIWFVQQLLRRTECCKDSSSQIVITFKEEGEEHRDIDPEISNWIKTVCSMEPEEGQLKNIYFPRLWREYKKQMSHFLLWQITRMHWSVPFL